MRRGDRGISDLDLVPRPCWRLFILMVILRTLPGRRFWKHGLVIGLRIQEAETSFGGHGAPSGASWLVGGLRQVGRRLLGLWLVSSLRSWTLVGCQTRLMSGLNRMVICTVPLIPLLARVSSANISNKTLRPSDGAERHNIGHVPA